MIPAANNKPEIKLQQKEVDVAHKTLGVWKNMIGHDTEQIRQYLRKIK
jgi:hypothetical protein